MDFPGNAWQIPSLKSHSLSATCSFKWKPCSVREAAGSDHHSSQQELFLQPPTNHHCTSECSPTALRAFPISSARMLKRHVPKGWDFIPLYTFYCFIKDIHQRDWLLFFSARTWLLVLFVPLPWFVLKHQKPYSWNFNPREKLYSFENSCDLPEFQKGSWEPQEVMNDIWEPLV